MPTLTNLSADGPGPGPWILLFPLLWLLVLAAVIWLARRAFLRGGQNPWRYRAAHGEHSPVALLGRRYAAGEIDEGEYRRRLAVLREAPTGPPTGTGKAGS
ncbi:SHOCT domain-containing protein [Streptomyces sp. NPDC005438]|uniref:SHOCT domain-containing protein n=1 Tax=Streptomyces sp. NPDC005438 TaxID=3156880 RepID=UPI0033A07920